MIARNLEKFQIIVLNRDSLEKSRKDFSTFLCIPFVETSIIFYLRAEVQSLLCNEQARTQGRGVNGGDGLPPFEISRTKCTCV